MSGDVQPRKRKDKKRKKDELVIEETRGTSAVFGDGDVFLHSHDDHGTGGHWCAKIIFFSLLAVLVTLVGLIIMENRGLSELEANSVASSYSGILDGWLEDPAAEHHDEHTLDLKHHDIKDDNEIPDDNYYSNIVINEDVTFEEENVKNTSNEEDIMDSEYYSQAKINRYDDVENERNGMQDYHENEMQSDELYSNEYEKSYKFFENKEKGDESEEDEEELTLEKIEKEIDSKETILSESMIQAASNDLEDENTSQENNDSEEDEENDEDEQENESSEPYEEIDEAPVIVEHITAPSGKPFRELDEEISTEHLTDTLLEEEEYEKHQEELRQQEEQSSHKDGGDDIKEEWPGEPNDPFWRQELDQAEQDLVQDWLN